MDPPRIPKGHAVRPLVLYDRSEVERFRTELAERRASRGVGIPVNQKKPIERTEHLNTQIETTEASTISVMMTPDQAFTCVEKIKEERFAS
jgi:hypothetical protein